MSFGRVSETDHKCTNKPYNKTKLFQKTPSLPSLFFSNATSPAYRWSLRLAGGRHMCPVTSDEAPWRAIIVGRLHWFWCWSENQTIQNRNCGYSPKPNRNWPTLATV